MCSAGNAISRGVLVLYIGGTNPSDDHKPSSVKAVGIPGSRRIIRATALLGQRFVWMDMVLPCLDRSSMHFCDAHFAQCSDDHHHYPFVESSINENSLKRSISQKPPAAPRDASSASPASRASVPSGYRACVRRWPCTL